MVGEHPMLGLGLAFGEVIAVSSTRSHLVQVSLDGMEPDPLTTVRGYWCTVMTPMAGSGRGLYALPTVGDLVVVGFLGGRADVGVVLGFRWGTGDDGVAQAPPFTAPVANPIKGWVSSAGHSVELDDTPGREQVRVCGADGRGSVVIDCATGEVVVNSAGPLTLKSAAGIALSAPAGDVSVECRGFTVAAQGAVDITGITGGVSVDAGLELKGASVKITGNPVDINAGALKVL